MKSLNDNREELDQAFNNVKPIECTVLAFVSD